MQAKAFAILERKQLERVADHIATNKSFDETAFQWEHFDGLAHQFKRRLRPILERLSSVYLDGVPVPCGRAK